jgi:hypothetical protein
MARAEDSRSVELVALKDWCLAIVQFIGSLDAPSKMSDSMNQIIREAHKRGDLRGLRTLSKEVVEWAGGLSRTNQRKLDAVLRLRFGRGLSSHAETKKEEVSGILRRNRIADEHEYRLLESRADDIYASKTNRSELDMINHLLSEYDKRDTSI